jgi:hypothetical protein
MKKVGCHRRFLLVTASAPHDDVFHILRRYAYVCLATKYRWVWTLYIVVYLLKARTVEAEKQPLLGNVPYTCRTGLS